MINGVHHVAVHTPDLEKLAAFYREAFGFEDAGQAFGWSGSAEIDAAIGVQGSAARTLMMRSRNCYIELFEFFSPPSRSSERLRPSDHGYTHFALDVTDIRSEMARLAALGMTFAADEPVQGDGISSVYGWDIDGNVVELQEVTAGHGFAFGRLTGRD
jgi:glyoxylase I family protein